jgi:hypothetical protein
MKTLMKDMFIVFHNLSKEIDKTFINRSKSHAALMELYRKDMDLRLE